jgi:uncharacterized membrane protein YsdA (DUF1294 family)
MRTLFLILFIYLALINIIGFALMGIDKKRAIRGAWRISESSLFLTAVLGGSIGCILGMQLFRHKTKHWYFKFGMPSILILQIVLITYLGFQFSA